MKKWLSTCFAAICISSSLQAQLENETLKLWYDGPATQWVEALPLGNGRIGAMAVSYTHLTLPTNSLV